MMALRNRNGFTMIELTVSLFLIALIVGLSSVYVSNLLPSSRFKSSVREIVATLRHAKALSRMSGGRKVVTFNLDTRRYGISGSAAKSIPNDLEIIASDPVLGELRKGEYKFVFYEDGSTEGGSIILKAKKAAAEIRPDPLLGGVSVKVES